MNQKFSTYLKNIGLLNETASSSILKSDEKLNNKSFNDSSFDLLMNYFNNLDEKQKKFMSYHIPSKFIIISSKMKKDKLRSIIVQSILRKKLILLKKFFSWKFITYIKKDNFDGIKNEISALHLRNIDNNVDPDIKDISKIEEEHKEIQSNRNSSCNENNYKHYSNNKNIRNTFNSNNSDYSNYKYINVYRNKNDSDLKSNHLSEDKIRPNNKYKKKKSFSSQKKNRVYKSIYRENNSTIKSHLLTSLEEKEMLELEECSFKPKINKIKNVKILNDINNNKKNKQAVFDKLYKYNEKYKLAKELRAIELEKIAGQKITFSPNTNPIRKKNKKIIKKSLSQLDINNKNNKKVLTRKNRVKSEGNLNLNFEERQKNYLIKKRKHSNEIKNQLDNIFNEICSFNPKINSDNNNLTNYCTNNNFKKNKKNTVFSRLYQEGKKRIDTRAKKEQKIINKILEMSNMVNPGKNFDINTINRLYENKEQKNNYKKVVEKVEKEEGTTFKPYISPDNYNMNINNTFFERNQKLINDRESFCEEENKKIIENEKKHIIGKEYTKEERQKVINNIINRLYNDSSFIKKSAK